MDELFFDTIGFELFEADEISEFEESRSEDIADTALTDDSHKSYFSRAAGYWQQVPLPPEVLGGHTNVLASLSDEDLLTMSASLLVHVQRTEAMGGMQVVSPRAVTLGGMAARTNLTHRTTDMFLVGSCASDNLDWPVVGEPAPAHLFWSEPIDSYPAEPAPRPRTVTEGVLSATREIDDPITKAFLLGRALVDLQRRPDVAGSGEQLAAVLSACWSIDAETYEDMGEASLAPVGSLLRYAIRSDTSYPVVNAPIQARLCMSVGANTAGRQLYGEDSAIDWRRLRVLAESVFYQSSRTEGYTMAQMMLDAPPGNPRAPPNRSGLLQMRPLPGSVWSFDSSTFRLDIEADVSCAVGVEVPLRVREAIERYHSTARPIAQAAAAGARISFVQSRIHPVPQESAESLVKGYKVVMTAASAFSARGKTSAAAVRGFVYDCLAEGSRLSSIRALWLARYMHETCLALNLSHMLDVTTTRHVAARMSDLVGDMRVRLGVEAGRRGSDLDEWWRDLASVLPTELRSMSEGSASWAMAAAHMMLQPPTGKWEALVRAMAHASHAALARGHLHDVRLPAKVRSRERTIDAASAVTRQLGTSYGAFYTAMYDVACVLSARLRRGGNVFGAEKILIAGLMWDMRAKIASTVRFHPDDDTSGRAGTIESVHGRCHLTTAPHSAYTRWHRALNAAPFVRLATKQMYPHHTPAVLSQTFADRQDPLFPVAPGAASRLYRYVTSPGRLAADMEKTLREIASDVQAVVTYYDTEELPHDIARVLTKSDEIQPLALNMNMFRPAEGSYWEVITQLDSAIASDVIDAVTRLDAAVAAEIESASYEGPKALEDAVWAAAGESAVSNFAARDAVI
jgi:hypothetical protein